MFSESFPHSRSLTELKGPSSVAGALTLFYLLASSAIAGSAPERLSSLRVDSRTGLYRQPTDEELRTAEKLFDLLLSGGEVLDKVACLSGAIGFELVPLSQGEEEIVLLRDSGATKRGWGAYAFRRAAADPLAIQAPHSYHDRYTGRLAEAFFFESRARCAAWNTAHRSTRVSQSDERADLARTARSVFQCFTSAFARAYPQGMLVQLHGYDSTTRRGKAGEDVSCILSNGTRVPAARLMRIGHCVSAQLPVTVCIYPVDTRELGGTTNVQGRLLRSRGHEGFLHVEMSLALRLELKENRSRRKLLWSCFGETNP